MASWAAVWPEWKSGKLNGGVGARLREALGARLNATLDAALGAAKQSGAAAAPRRYMPGAPEIYFRKAIDNSRLVRAVDPAVKREMRLFAGTVAVCFMMALLYLGQHCSSIECGYRIEELRRQCDQMSQVNRTLRLEEATLKDPERINALAGQMGLALPAVGQVQHMNEADGRDSGAPVMARADSFSVISVPN